MTIETIEPIDQAMLGFCRRNHFAMPLEISSAEIATEEQRIRAFVEDHGYEYTEDMHNAIAFLAYDAAKEEYVLSPNKVGEFIGINGKGVQGRLRYGTLNGRKTPYGWWVISTDTMLELFIKQKEKEKRVNGNQNN